MGDANTHLRIEGVPFCIVDHCIPPELRPRDMRCGWRLDAPPPTPELEQLRRVLAPLDVHIRVGHCPTDYAFYGEGGWQMRAACRMVRRCKELIRRVTS